MTGMYAPAAEGAKAAAAVLFDGFRGSGVPLPRFFGRLETGRRGASGRRYGGQPDPCAGALTSCTGSRQGRMMYKKLESPLREPEARVPFAGIGRGLSGEVNR
jgi:hypothetical protein